MFIEYDHPSGIVPFRLIKDTIKVQETDYGVHVTGCDMDDSTFREISFLIQDDMSKIVKWL
jgi:hypothetical protein